MKTAIDKITKKEVSVLENADDLRKTYLESHKGDSSQLDSEYFKLMTEHTWEKDPVIICKGIIRKAFPNLEIIPLNIFNEKYKYIHE